MRLRRAGGPPWYCQEEGTNPLSGLAETGDRTPMENKQDSKSPRSWVMRLALPGGGTGVGEAGALEEAHPGGSRTQWGAGCPWRHTPAPQSGARSG